MQSIADASINAAAHLRHAADQQRQERRSLQRQLIADLESPRRHNRNRYPAIAELLQREAASAGKLFQYIDLIWLLGASDVSERIEPQVAQALRDVWGLR